MTRRRCCVVLALGVLAMATGVSCRKEGRRAAQPPSPVPTGPVVRPVVELECSPMVEGGQTGCGFFGRLPGQEAHYEVWQWDEAQADTMRKAQAFTLPSVAGFLMYDAIVVPGNRYLGNAYRKSPHTPNLLLASSETHEVIKEWTPPEWHPYFDRRGVSSNGLFAALLFQSEMNMYRYSVGRLDLRTLELDWVGELAGHGSGTLRQIAVSDDGHYIALGGWSNGVAMVDASQKEVLWIARPPTEVTTTCAVFSADGLTLYTAGSEGCVYRIETRTGQITGQWWVTETGRSEYGHRVSCLAMSPDGQWLAAGTGPEGHVYVWSIASGDTKPRLLCHGIRTILEVCFSRDSTHLASVAGNKIKVWKVKEGE